MILLLFLFPERETKGRKGEVTGPEWVETNRFGGYGSGRLCLAKRWGGFSGQQGYGERLTLGSERWRGSHLPAVCPADHRGAQSGLVEWTYPGPTPHPTTPHEKTPTSLTQVAVPRTGSSSFVTFRLPAACLLWSFTLREEFSSQNESGAGGQAAPTPW